MSIVSTILVLAAIGLVFLIAQKMLASLGGRV